MQNVREIIKEKGRLEARREGQREGRQQIVFKYAEKESRYF